MPLPDERPRASVANLIGRFEQQTTKQAKRLSFTGAQPGAVSSHTTGDSAKEWPPKPAFSPAPSYIRSPPTATITLLSPPMSPPRVQEHTLPSPPATIAVETALSPALSALALSGSEPVSPIAPVPVPVPVAATSQEEKKTVPSTVVSPAKKAPMPTSAARTPMKAKAPPPSSFSPSIAAIKPQHTGGTYRKPATPAKSTPTTGLRSSMSTPARAKTPQAPSSRSKTPSSAQHTPIRAKTPSHAPPTRSKTPSGLSAPTAASLARQRNAQPVPPPVKKTTLSAAAADRLSKPTAASLSKMRTPVVVPTRTPVKAAAARGGAAPTKPRSSGISAKKAAAVVAGTAAAAAAVVVGSDETAYEVPESHVEVEVEHAEEPEYVDEPEHVEEEPEHVEQAEQAEEEGQHHEAPELAPESLTEDSSSTPLPPSTPSPVKDDIADMVNFLESSSVTSKPRPTSIASIPDEDDE